MGSASWELLQMNNDFVSMVSHELRTPLASIKAYIEMLIDGEADDQKTQRQFYDVIQGEANRLSSLIDDILSISRLESGLMRAHKKPHVLAEIVRDSIETVAVQARHKNISLTQKITAGSYRARVDRQMLYQALLHLLANSIKYTPAGGCMTVESFLDQPSKRLVTKVIDNGVGIPPKDLPFVFDKFYRAASTSRMAPGTGLGLALVRQIVETVHHGRMLVESHVGSGSSFGFELELYEESPLAEALARGN